MKESAILLKIQAAVVKEFPTAWIRKLADRFTRGLPDLIICYQREKLLPPLILSETKKNYYSTSPEFAVLFVEVKRPDGSESKIQELERSRVTTLGGSWIVASSAAEVINYMRC